MRKMLSIVQAGIAGGLLVSVLSASQLAFAQCSCTLPAYVSPAPNAGVGFYDSGGNQLYYVFNNIFYATQYPGTSGTIRVCSPDEWSDVLVANNNNGDGAVKAFVSTQRNYNNTPIASFPVLKISFAATAWNSGIYEVAFDHFLNNYANEVMIWTENHNQLPAGSIIRNNITVDGQTWDLWQAGGLFTFAAPHLSNGFPSNRVISSGTFNMLTYFTYLISAGLLSPTTTVAQLQYGLELVDTGNVRKTFSVSHMTIKDH